ncbi:MAG: twin-arginine translocase TatA/TatE family subunit [Candidatus Tectomicrobia bacterium]|uniref:Sec-independent protein translocase protein TatA n=1 Tax=Tectimicrobiota bacterium TaxID=2528274 RepID=A0A932GNQ7_UNCTE|nr:twin-arginine translocase TatA/TatE family subunit [Candidatus Tectomicrobia bacterium]
MFGDLGMPELIVILAIAVLIFGAGKLPELGSSMGKAIRNFKAGMREAREEIGEKKSGPEIPGTGKTNR